MRPRRVVAVAVTALAVLCPWDGYSQEHFAVQTNLIVYGDNTEFRNPFREGETILGAAIRVAGVIDLNDRVNVSIGVFGNQRFGSESGFEQVRPVLSLSVRGRRSAFVFGTLTAPKGDTPLGPDHDGPHDLLPPIQRETLIFDRPYEAGLSWNFTGATLRHDVWLNWQRINTPKHRERFDGGVNASVRLTDVVSLPLQVHIVHEGGQLHSAGPVADSAAAATGVTLHRQVLDRYAGSLELWGALSRHVPDRSRPDLQRDGTGFFGRASAERAGWRAHVLFWRGWNFVKDEGDPNYLAVTRSGERYRGTRDYSEAGLTRRFTLASAAVIDVSGRLHRIEHHYEYLFPRQKRRVNAVGDSLKKRN